MLLNTIMTFILIESSHFLTVLLKHITYFAKFLYKICSFLNGVQIFYSALFYIIIFSPLCDDVLIDFLHFLKRREHTRANLASRRFNWWSKKVIFNSFMDKKRNFFLA